MLYLPPGTLEARSASTAPTSPRRRSQRWSPSCCARRARRDFDETLIRLKEESEEKEERGEDVDELYDQAVDDRRRDAQRLDLVRPAPAQGRLQPRGADDRADGGRRCRRAAGRHQAARGLRPAARRRIARADATSSRDMRACSRRCVGARSPALAARRRLAHAQRARADAAPKPDGDCVDARRRSGPTPLRSRPRSPRATSSRPRSSCRSAATGRRARRDAARSSSRSRARCAGPTTQPEPSLVVSDGRRSGSTIRGTRRSRSCRSARAILSAAALQFLLGEGELPRRVPA